MTSPSLACIFAVLLVASAQAQTSGILREVWTNVSGSNVSDLLNSPNYPVAPVWRGVGPDFRTPVDWQENYGVRVRAFLTPTTSADYTFWISGDDQCELWLSTDATPEKRVRIARTPSWTAPLLWTKFPEQRSVPVTLAAGQRYYIEALMKEGTGGDSLAVAWADSPTGTPAVIGGGNLAPFEAPPTIPIGLLVEAGQAIRQYAPNLKIDLSAQALDLASPSRGATVAWSQVGGSAALIRTPGNANTEVDLPAVGTYTFRATASNSSGTVTDDVVVTILPKLAPDAGSALTEFWFGIDGRAVSNLTSSSDYPGNPHAHRTVTSLTAVDQIAEQFGDRTRGFLLVPVTGSYRFFLAANETAEFFLSTDQTTANLRSLATVSVTQITAGQLTSLGQGTDPVELVAGRRYAFQVLRKDDWGTDSCSLMWQRPGSGYAEEITTEYLAPPSDGPAATLASQALALDSDFVIHAGRDQILYLPRQSLSLSAYEQRRYGSDVPVRTWSQVSGPGGVVFSSPGTAQTSVTLPRAGVYVLRYKVQTARNTTIDDVRIEVRSALSASAGAFTRQVWWRRNFASLDAFRADPSFPRFPDIVDNISELRQNADWSDLYATRVTGLLRVPPGPETAVDYRFAVSGDEAVEFSISTGPGAEELRRVAFSTRPSGRDNIRNEASQISSPISLRPGGSYFVEMLHRETWSSDYFAVSWSRSGDNRFSVIDGSFAEPTANVQAFSGAVNAYANAGRDRTYWWPHQKTRLSGATIRYRDSGTPPVVSWRQVAGPAATFSTTSELTPEVTFSGPGLCTFELSVSDGGLVHRDTVVFDVKRAQPGVTGYLTRSVWLDVDGSVPANLRTVDPQLAFPHFEDLLPGVEPPTNWADFTGTRLKGTLTVPISGQYTFWIVSEDASELSLDVKDGSGLRRIATCEHGESPMQFDVHAWQKSLPLELQAGVSYPIEAVQKELNGNDHLAIAMDGPATNGREVLSRGFLTPANAAPIFNPELTVALGVDRTLLWPQKSLTVAALVYDLKPGPGPLTYRWSTPSRGVVFDAPSAPVSGIEFPAPGIFQITMTASDGTNTNSDSMTITVRDPLTASSGGILREVWTGIGGTGINDLKNSSAYLNKPANIRDVLPSFEAPGNWADNYGQRLTGLISVPVEGDYVFLIASDDESELLFNSSGEDPSGASRVARCPWAVGRYNWSSRPEQQSAVFHLVPDKKYFIQAFQKEGGGDDYLAVAYRKATDTSDKAIVIPGIVLSPPVGTAAAAFDGQMAVEAGEDINSLWPKARYSVRGSAVDYVPGPQAMIYRWSVLSGAAAPRAARPLGAVPKASVGGVVFSAPTALSTDVQFPGPGRYVLQLTATDGLLSRSDTLTVNIGNPLASGTGSILCETFRNITGSWITDLTRNSRYPNSPDDRTQLRSAEIRPNSGDNYGVILRGWLHAPVRGVYRFNIASDEWGEAYLSTDETAENKSLLCFTPAAVNYYEWRRFPDYQLSRPVQLEAGKRYYLEIRMKESGWNDHVALAWLRPGTAAFEVIDGPYLSPWRLADSQAPTITLTGGNAVTVEVGGSYVDPGFSASDLVDGDVTQRVTQEGTVDVNTPGTYTIRYTVTDSSGNVSTIATRTVTVALAANVNPVYPPDASGAHPTLPWSQSGAITDLEAARFLRQATFGPTDAAIARVKAIGYSAWIDEQLALPATSHLEAMERVSRYQGARTQLLALAKSASDLSILPGSMMPVSASNLRTDDRLWAWWTIAATAPDQLRQRMAFALSEILVISDRGGALRNYPQGVANYYDLLVKHSNGNYRALLEEITLNPIMGIWLTMVRSNKAQPDENYAREIMQLFSIGLEHLNRDGTYKRDANGDAIPTYSQTEINELARAFTGWTYAGSRAFTWTDRTDVINPLMSFDEFHDRGRKVILGGASLSAGQTTKQDMDRSLDVIANHPNVGPFISTLLIKRLVTSNPSPAYVFRVTSKFDNNGRGVRGDLGAVLKAILLDPEARASSPPPAHGKLGEPILRLTRVIRALPRAPAGNPPILGRYLLNSVLEEFNQAPLQAPTVFNFFLPTYQPPGPLLAAGLTAPEFEITTELSAVDTANYLFDGVTSGFDTNSGARIGVDQTSLEALWATPNALYARIETLLLARPMSAELRLSLERVKAAYTSTSEGVRAMLQIVVSSPEFSVDR